MNDSTICGETGCAPRSREPGEPHRYTQREAQRCIGSDSRLAARLRNDWGGRSRRDSGSAARKAIQPDREVTDEVVIRDLMIFVNTAGKGVTTVLFSALTAQDVVVECAPASQMLHRRRPGGELANGGWRFGGGRSRAPPEPLIL